MGYSESDLPSRYARDWRRAAARALERYAPAIRDLQAKGLLAGAPVELLCAFICAGSPTSNTTDARSGKGLEVAFHEGGLWQTPMGGTDRDPVTKVPRAPAPNPDPRAPYNTWGRLHDDAQIVAALGRPAPMAPGAWKTDLAAQHAVGLAMLRDDYAAVRRNLPATIAPSGPQTLWGLACMFTGFSAGPAAAAALFNRFAWHLEAAPEELRWRALLRGVTRELAGGWMPGGSPDHHGNACHRVLRTWQKFETAKAIAAPDRAVFFDAGLGAQQDLLERMILRANWGLAQTSEDVAALDAGT